MTDEATGTDSTEAERRQSPIESLQRLDRLFQAVDFEVARASLLVDPDQASLIERMPEMDEPLRELAAAQLELLDPDVELDFSTYPMGAPTGNCWKGLDGWAAFWREWLEMWEGFVFQAWGLRAGGRPRRVSRAYRCRTSLSVMRFEKWTALGNDYLIVEESELPWELTEERIRRLCDPQAGIGSDGVLVLSPTEDERFVAELRIFNPDGSEAELSGNGSRQAVLYLRQRDWIDEDSFSIITKAGEITATITGASTVTMDIGRASLTSPDYPSGPADGTGALIAAGREWHFQHVNVGNPQCVIDVGEEVESLDLAAIGPEIERSELFPNRTNVSFIKADGSTVRARIFERGVGETLSSGTGASGAAVAAHLDGGESPITVKLDGGELTVDVSDNLDISLTGTAEPVQAGELSAELAQALG